MSTALALPTLGALREDTALAVGATVAGYMSDAELAALGLLPPALKHTKARRMPRNIGRRVHRRAAALFAHAQQQAEAAIDRAEQRITGETLTSLAHAGTRLAPPVAVPGGSSWTRLKATIRDAVSNAIAELDGAFQRAADAIVGDAAGVMDAQHVLDELATNGLTAYVDKTGRRWGISSYTEMATRTAASRLALAVQLRSMAGARLDLVMVDKASAAPGCPQCRPYEGQVLSVGGFTRLGSAVTAADSTGHRHVVNVKATLAQATARGLLHPSCFPAGVPVSAPSGVVAADARRYEGPLVVIHTASGDELPVTPNHPILTPEGWVPAGDLRVGQDVLRHRADVEGVPLGAPDDEQVPARIGDVFDALRQSGTVVSARVPVAAEQFHGDGVGSDVEVVLTDGLLRDRPWEQVGQRELVSSRIGAQHLPADSAPFEFVDGSAAAASGLVRSGHLGSAFLCRHGRPFPALSGAPVGAVATPQKNCADGGLCAVEGSSDLRLRNALFVESDGFGDPGVVPLLLDSGSAELAVQGRLADANGGRDLVGALTGSVSPDRVVEVEVRREWSGHVYNLQTRDGWYVAGGIVVHNCRHFLVPFVDRMVLRVPPPGEADMYRAQRRQRALERVVRARQRRAAVALTQLAKARARRDVAEAQARLVEHRLSGTLPVVPPARRPLRLAEQRRPVAQVAQAETPTASEQATARRKLRLSKAERSALNLYTGNGHVSMNDYLTNGRKVIGPAGDDTEYVQHVAGNVAALERLINRSPLAEDQDVTRGIWTRVAEQVFGPVGSRVGDVFTENRFTSTTSDDLPPLGFGDVVLRYHLKAGVKALDVNSVKGGVESENEVLVGPGRRFRVLADRLDDRGRRFIELESA